ncbi:MAG: hypothetical protein ABTQ32_36915 [Myxococcaceae bacterium]
MARWALVALLAGCSTPQERRDACFSGFGHDTSFSGEVELTITGNPGSAMEPRLSPDERFLFWNDKPASDDAMQLHVATRVDAGVYSYVGPLEGANVDGFLDGVPAIDSSNRFFFVSLRTYGQNMRTIYSARFDPSGPRLTDVTPIDDAISEKKAGVVDIDIDVSNDGTVLIVSRAEFAPGSTGPSKSRLEIFGVDAGVPFVSPALAAWPSRINESTTCRQYAAHLSSDGLELFSTVLPLGAVEPADFRLAVSRRSSVTEPFGPGATLDSISGLLLEGPNLSLDGKRLTYHRFNQTTGRWGLYQSRRP